MTSSYFSIRATTFIFGVAAMTLLLTVSPFVDIKDANAHFLGGDTINIDKYQVTFVPYPSDPEAGSNSTTLNFSVLENNSNIYNTYSALTITKLSGSGETIAQYPYKLYIFSDMTFPFVFNETGDYGVTLQTRIIGDPKYEATPLEATFDLSVVSPFQAMLAGMLSNRVILLVIIIVPIIGIGTAVWIYARKRI